MDYSKMTIEELMQAFEELTATLIEMGVNKVTLKQNMDDKLV